MAKKKPAAAKQLQKVTQPYWHQALDLRPPASAAAEPDDAPHGGHPSPTTPHPGPKGGGSGGGGAGGGSGSPAATPDWEQVLIAQGMPPSLVSSINDYMKAHADDPDLKDKVLAIVRGSDWWKQTFPGFWAGAGSGLFGDETGYRSWYKAANDAFKRYYGRDMTANETVDFLTKGFSPGTIESIGGGHAWATANNADLGYYFGAFDSGQLDAGQKETLGQQYAGRQSDAGSILQQKFEAAQQKAARVFQGVLASPNLQIGGGGLSAPSLNPKPKPDIAA